jgi:hypothetical protein
MTSKKVKNFPDFRCETCEDGRIGVACAELASVFHASIRAIFYLFPFVILLCLCKGLKVSVFFIEF